MIDLLVDFSLIVGVPLLTLSLIYGAGGPVVRRWRRR